MKPCRLCGEVHPQDEWCEEIKRMRIPQPHVAPKHSDKTIHVKANFKKKEKRDSRP